MDSEKLATGTDGETAFTGRKVNQPRGEKAFSAAQEAPKPKRTLAPKINMDDGYFPPRDC